MYLLLADFKKWGIWSSYRKENKLDVLSSSVGKSPLLWYKDQSCKHVISFRLPYISKKLSHLNNPPISPDSLTVYRKARFWVVNKHGGENSDLSTTLVPLSLFKLMVRGFIWVNTEDTVLSIKDYFFSEDIDLRQPQTMFSKVIPLGLRTRKRSRLVYTSITALSGLYTPLKR